MRFIVFSTFAAIVLLLLPAEVNARSCAMETWPCFEKASLAPQAATRGRSSSAGERDYSSSGLPASVRAALSDVRSSCSGFRVISMHRPGARVAGTGRVSLHAYGLAADFRVSNYGCAYGVLQRHNVGWSRDGGRCGHIHVSDGSRIGRHEPAGFRHGRC